MNGGFRMGGCSQGPERRAETDGVIGAGLLEGALIWPFLANGVGALGCGIAGLQAD